MDNKIEPIETASKNRLLTQKQLKDYSENGFLLMERVFKSKELNTVLDWIDFSINEHKMGKKYLEGLVCEENTKNIRTINGLHLYYEFFKHLCCYPSLLLPAQEIIGDINLYVHQFKVNFKDAFSGDIWDWHQDYIFWLKGDGMLQPTAASVAIFLDDVNEFNGPLMFIPGSHKIGTIDVNHQVNPQQDSWLDNVTANLKYKAPNELITELVKKNGLIAPKPAKGDVLFFDCNILHGSNSNISPFFRRTLYITYNAVSNVTHNFALPRPEFLASRDFTRLSLLKNNGKSMFESFRSDNK